MTGRNILNIALDLMNVRSSDGVLPSNCADMESRAINIINICLAQCAPLNSLLCKRERYIPVLKNLDENVEYDESLLLSVIPYGVAADLSSDEDPSLSNKFEEKYRYAYRSAFRYSRARLHSVTEVY